MRRFIVILLLLFSPLHALALNLQDQASTFKAPSPHSSAPVIIDGAPSVRQMETGVDLTQTMTDALQAHGEITDAAVVSDCMFFSACPVALQRPAYIALPLLSVFLPVFKPPLI